LCWRETMLSERRLEASLAEVHVDLARADSIVLHPAPDRPAPGQPAHDRLLPRYLLAPTRLRPGQGWPIYTFTPTDLDIPLIGGFPRPVRTRPAHSVRIRNARLVAHSLFRYTASRKPAHAGLIQRVSAIRRNDSTAPRSASLLGRNRGAARQRHVFQTWSVPSLVPEAMRLPLPDQASACTGLLCRA
jgi:hypothetical protein